MVLQALSKILLFVYCLSFLALTCKNHILVIYGFIDPSLRLLQAAGCGGSRKEADSPQSPVSLNA